MSWSRNAIHRIHVTKGRKKENKFLLGGKKKNPNSRKTQKSANVMPSSQYMRQVDCLCTSGQHATDRNKKQKRNRRPESVVGVSVLNSNWPMNQPKHQGQGDPLINISQLPHLGHDSFKEESKKVIWGPRQIQRKFFLLAFQKKKGGEISATWKDHRLDQENKRDETAAEKMYYIHERAKKLTAERVKARKQKRPHAPKQEAGKEFFPTGTYSCVPQ